MSESPKVDAAGPSDTFSQQTAPAVQVDKSIPEPTAGHLPTLEHTSQTAVASEDTPAEKVKETEKSEDLARSLLKGFQNKIAGVFPKKSEKPTESKESKKEEPTDVKEDKREEEKEVKEVKERRSASRKRNSIFGNFGLGRKEEKSTLDESTSPETGKVSTSEPIDKTESAPEPSTKSDTAATSEPTPDRPVPTKRSSIFDSFRNQFVKKEKSDANTTAVKESETLSTVAPVIPAVGSPEPEKDTQKPDPITEKINETQATLETKADKLTSKAEKRKSSLPFSLGLGKKDKLATSRDEDATEKPLSPFAKLRATVKSKTSPKISIDKNESNTVNAPSHEPASEPKTDKAPETGLPQPIISEPEPAVQASVPEVAASA